jgi:hypothetical protein
MNSRLRVVTLAALASITIVAVASMAQGSDGQPLLAGRDNTETQGTVLTNSTDGGNALSLTSSGTALNVATTSDGWGIQAYATQHNGGVAVHAVAGSGSDAVQATGAAGGNALIADGRSYFSDGPVVFASSSGQAVVPAGSKSVTVRPGNGAMTSSTQVLALLQTHRVNVWVIGAVPEPKSGSIRIFLNKPPAQDADVAWFIVD